MEKTLTHLKPGDEVVLVPNNYYKRPTIERIDRVTKTMIVLRDTPLRFTRELGYLIGHGIYNATYIRELEEGEKEKILVEQEKRTLIKWFTTLTSSSHPILSNLPLEILKEIKAKIESYSPF